MILPNLDQCVDTSLRFSFITQSNECPHLAVTTFLTKEAVNGAASHQRQDRRPDAVTWQAHHKWNSHTFRRERAGRKQTLNLEFISILNFFTLKFLLNFIFHFYCLLFTFLFWNNSSLREKSEKQFSEFTYTLISSNVVNSDNQSIFIKTRKLTLVYYYSLNYRPYSNFSFPLSFSPASAGSNSWSCVVKLHLLHLEPGSFSVFPCLSWSLPFEYWELFCMSVWVGLIGSPD